jgi:membrane-associated protease RseP (regulator of RpoE activity)
MNLDWNLISIIVFYSLIALFLFIRRKRVEVQSKIFFLYKTKRFNKLMKSIANKAPRFWKWFGYAAIPIGFIGMAFIFGYLTYALIQLILVKPETATISLLIPGVKIPGSSFFVPFWYGIIALFFVILVHEGAHGLVSEAFKNKVKSSGVGLLLLLPLAFVEPDEKQLKKQNWKTQMAIFGAGTMANFVSAAITLALAVFLIVPLVNAVIVPSGLTIDSVTKGQPAELAGLSKNITITAIDSQNITDATSFLKYMQTITPGEVVNIAGTGKVYPVTTIASPKNASLAYIGVNVKQDMQIKPEVKAKYGNLPWCMWYFLQLLYWIFTLNLGIGLINLLPLGPIDGGRMAKIGIEQAIKNREKAKKVFGIISALSLLLLLANLIGPYIRMAF